MVMMMVVVLMLHSQVPGGWQLDGQKRWIGNGTWADVSVVWARSSDSGEVGSGRGTWRGGGGYAGDIATCAIWAAGWGLGAPAA